MCNVRPDDRISAEKLKTTIKLKSMRGFAHLRLLCVTINLPYGLAWNTDVMSGLVILGATRKC